MSNILQTSCGQLARAIFLIFGSGLAILTSPNSVLANGGFDATSQPGQENNQGAPDELLCKNCPPSNGFAPLTPPSGFDPLTASSSVLSFYGIPPRPDPVKAPSAYAMWKRIVTAPATRITPELQPLDLYHGPNRAIATVGTPVNGVTPATSGNWSGYVVADSNDPFRQNNTIVEAVTEFIVPYVHQPSGTCTLSFEIAGSWVGFDGATGIGSTTSTDVLQAGVSAAANCLFGQVLSQSYFAWFEWFPLNSVQISNFPVRRGDDVFIEVWTTSPTQGFAFVYNVSTQKSVTIAISPPAGVSLTGDSVEWIVEAPTTSRGQSALPAYSAIPMEDCFATIFSQFPTIYAPGNTPEGAIYSVTMLNQHGAAISDAYTTPANVLTYVDPQNSTNGRLGSAVWFLYNPHP
jgi:hypothetical protein